MTGAVKPEQVKNAAEQIRDEWTEKRTALIYPMAMDVIANTPALCLALAERLSK